MDGTLLIPLRSPLSFYLLGSWLCAESFQCLHPLTSIHSVVPLRAFTQELPGLLVDQPQDEVYPALLGR